MKFLYFIIPVAMATTVVQTYVSPHYCSGCDAWTSMIDDVAADFPALEFHTVEFDVESATQNTVLPYTTALGRIYSFPQRSDYLYRWLTDVSYNRSTLLLRNVSLLAPWHVGFGSWVHIISAVRPLVDNHAQRLLPVGFAWTYMNHTSFFNTVTYQCLDGEIFQRHNVSDMNVVIRDLLPRVVPYALSESPAGRALLQYYSTVVYLISPAVPDNLPTNVAWVHLSGNESHVRLHNMSVPSAWCWKRRVEFMLPTVERGPLLAWVSDILTGYASPVYRPSSARDGDLSGDEVWDWVRAREHAVIFEYASEESLGVCLAALANVSYDVGQVDIRMNDHESFPSWSKPGMVHYYINGTRKKTLRCGQVHVLENVSKI